MVCVRPAANIPQGTNQQQDTRFSDKEKKLLKQMKFGDCLNKKVDMTKVKLDVLRPWISKKITDILHIEDDVVVEFVFNQLEEEKFPCPKKMQINMTGFLNGRNARQFMDELWALLLSAQDSETGIPAEFIQQKKDEILRREAAEAQALADAAQRAKDEKDELEQKSRSSAVAGAESNGNSQSTVRASISPLFAELENIRQQQSASNQAWHGPKGGHVVVPGASVANANVSDEKTVESKVQPSIQPLLSLTISADDPALVRSASNVANADAAAEPKPAGSRFANDKPKSLIARSPDHHAGSNEASNARPNAGQPSASSSSSANAQRRASPRARSRDRHHERSPERSATRNAANRATSRQRDRERSAGRRDRSADRNSSNNRNNSSISNNPNSNINNNNRESRRGRRDSRNRSPIADRSSGGGGQQRRDNVPERAGADRGNAARGSPQRDRRSRSRSQRDSGKRYKRSPARRSSRDRKRSASPARASRGGGGGGGGGAVDRAPAAIASHSNSSNKPEQRTRDRDRRSRSRERRDSPSRRRNGEASPPAVSRPASRPVVKNNGHHADAAASGDSAAAGVSKIQAKLLNLAGVDGAEVAQKLPATAAPSLALKQRRSRSLSKPKKNTRPKSRSRCVRRLDFIL